MQPLPFEPSKDYLSRRRRRRSSKASTWRNWLVWGGAAWIMAAVAWDWAQTWQWRSPSDLYWNGDPVPLAMEGGDPYIRALMRTISASESHDPEPYTLLYGGTHVEDLSQHPDRCVPIRSGPNEGQCTTAAGRYQFITTTWVEKAERYHPHPRETLFWHSYDFSPASQDAVVYGWLTDSHAWGEDLAELLREGDLTSVLTELSGTWTSLGYGIETNRRSHTLPEVYQEVLEEELQIAQVEESHYDSDR